MGKNCSKADTVPVVSVIMGVYNQWDREMLYASVDSVLDQTLSDLEFIIWDDGSDAEAAEIIQELTVRDPRIRVAGKEENHGLAFSLNECIKLARGKYIARMDADDISRPERLEKQVRFLEEHTEYAWCGTWASLFDEEGIWGIRHMAEEPGIRDYFQYSPFIHPSVMFRAELFDEQRGYLDTQETLRCEDYEIFLNLTQRGLKGYNLQEDLFCYRETRDSYKKRKMCFRINEAKMRYRNFKKVGRLFPVGWVYVLRPIVAGLLPACVIALLKRAEGHAALRQDEIQEPMVEVAVFEPRREISKTHSGLWSHPA